MKSMQIIGRITITAAIITMLLMTTTAAVVATACCFDSSGIVCVVNASSDVFDKLIES